MYKFFAVFIFLSFALATAAQKPDVYLKLTDAGGQLIKGDVVTKGFEKWMAATTITSGGKNNTQLNFTMAISGASADLKKALANGELLLTGQVSVLAPNPSGGSPVLSFTIKMERIAVSTCYEAMGCNNIMNTTVTLQATRIGYTYYDKTKTGTQAVSRKFGWDAESNIEWTNF